MSKDEKKKLKKTILKSIYLNIDSKSDKVFLIFKLIENEKTPNIIRITAGKNSEEICSNLSEMAFEEDHFVYTNRKKVKKETLISKVKSLNTNLSIDSFYSEFYLEPALSKKVKDYEKKKINIILNNYNKHNILYSNEEMNKIGKDIHKDVITKFNPSAAAYLSMKIYHKINEKEDVNEVFQSEYFNVKSKSSWELNSIAKKIKNKKQKTKSEVKK